VLKKFKNLKITHGIIVICVLAIISTGLIGILGLSNLNQLSKNVDIIYEEQLLTIEKVGTINAIWGFKECFY
jgi:hypothetical protein